jgi:NADH:ubiquinone oxidoreductase subunit F (NADH-binding)/(2Fe-2S) ferredoxin/NAD-dependent dihydropyrimidine dehydrogenase PreA subunit
MRFKSGIDLETYREQLKQKTDPNRIKIRICMTGCRAYGAVELRDAFREQLREQNLEDQVDMVETGCHGFCAKAPVCVVEPMGVFYHGLTPKVIPEIVEQTIKHGKIVEEYVFQDEKGNKYPYEKEIPFYKTQVRVVLRNCGRIDPTSIDAYIENDGYQAISRVLSQMTPEDVIDVVKKSGLRGRGGAGFPTATKWSFARSAPGDEKYIICNADEGDPGAFMDRAVLEGDPHSVIEGMMIGAYAIGAQTGYIYVRAEYPIAVQHLKIAIEKGEKMGLLGENILRSGFNFRIILKEGAGAFVCGEETALIASIEGKRGMPRTRPPFPAVSGLWGKPTNINNVETWANVPSILLHGSNWYAAMGTETSKGTKVFALAGKVNHTGLVEVPMGITLKELIFEVGGGIPNGKAFKAAQTGGPSGGCIPENLLHLPIDYESLAKAGAIMGSGGLIVVDEETCMVDIAKYFLTFTQNESCGKCVPCRMGTKRMLEILTKICEGNGKPEDIDTLRGLAENVKDTSLCGLGQTAPNPVLTTLNQFLHEYQEHIENKRCPAGVCRALISFHVDAEKCTGCGRCKVVCPQKAVSGEKKEVHTIDQNLCIQCGICKGECKFDSIYIV